MGNKIVKNHSSNQLINSVDPNVYTLGLMILEAPVSPNSLDNKQKCYNNVRNIVYKMVTEKYKRCLLCRSCVYKNKLCLYHYYESSENSPKSKKLSREFVHSSRYDLALEDSASQLKHDNSS